MWTFKSPPAISRSSTSEGRLRDTNASAHPQKTTFWRKQSFLFFCWWLLASPPFPCKSAIYVTPPSISLLAGRAAARFLSRLIKPTRPPNTLSWLFLPPSSFFVCVFVFRNTLFSFVGNCWTVFQSGYNLFCIPDSDKWVSVALYRTGMWCWLCSGCWPFQ